MSPFEKAIRQAVRADMPRFRMTIINDSPNRIAIKSADKYAFRFWGKDIAENEVGIRSQSFGLVMVLDPDLIRYRLGNG